MTLNIMYPVETTFLFFALASYLLAAGCYLAGLRVLGEIRIKLYFFAKSSAILLHSLSLGLRWDRLDHGPFINLHEILSSSIWSLALLTSLVFLLVRSVRSSFALVEVVLILLCAWLVITPAGDTLVPPTYDTIWLYFHVIAGKFFLALLLVSASLGVKRLQVTLSKTQAGSYSGLMLDELAYRFLAIAVVFESMMLLVGAIWAQDAWGRYWAWDPLETWSFLTWLVAIFILHLRLYKPVNPVVPTALIPLVFILAFLTFFGVPFLSIAPHKGMI
jgi:ABC-type transport system involved in cytochrome c biogenesis permease subunit